MRHVRRLLVVLTGVLIALAPVGAAHAQELSGQGPSNFRTVMTSPRSAAPGLSVRVIENGARVEVRNTGPADVVVLGYMSEPFLRIGPEGVFENRQSPAVELSRDRWGSVKEESDLRPDGAPQWRRVSAEPVARWYDQRVHWMVRQRLPPRVMAEPDNAHRVQSWTVPIRLGDRDVSATGVVLWEPGPSPWPGIAVAAVLACLVVAAAFREPVRRRARLVYGVLAAVTAAASLLHLLLVALEKAGGFGAKAGAFFSGNLLQLLSCLIAFAGAALLVRGRIGGAWPAAPATAVLAMRVVGYDLPVLWRSTSPFAGPLFLDRTLTVLVLGLGAGTAVALVLLVRRATRQTIPATDEAAHPRPVEPDDETAHAAAAEKEEALMGKARKGRAAKAAAGRGTTGVPAPGRNAPAADTSGSVLVAEPETSANGGLPTDSPADDSGVSRRRLLGVAGAAGAGGLVIGAAGGAAGATLLGDEGEDSPALTSLGSTTVPFHGERQAGITTPMQARASMLAWDLEPGADRAAVAALMRRWSDTASRLSRAERVDGDDQVALDAGPCSLTVTFGFGASMFGKIGLTDRLPAALKPLPPFPGDALDPDRGDGDLFTQVCADDGLVAFHAVRALQRLGRGVVRVRWLMNGFTRSPGATAKPMTHRNAMGQIDGTNNPDLSDPAFGDKIFVGADTDQTWLTGGSYLVFRRIRMLLDDWDGVDQPRQERIIGRTKETGAPLSGGAENTPADFGKRAPDGRLLIAADAHIRVSAPESNRGATMLRRGYSYHDGFGSDGAPDAGLLFLAWQHDPEDGFVPVQRKLARGDALSPFIRHETSALFVIPPGCPKGGYIGQSLLEA